MTQLPRLLTPHTVLFQEHGGESAYGDIYEPERALQWVKVDEKTQLVRSATGEEAVSSAQVYCRPKHAPLPVKSLVTLPSGRTSKVIRVDHLDHRPAPEHYVLYLE
ncbi:hypothetical protein ACFSYH_01945 [Populibacterium corticicola]|uniref:Head-tail adaptor protein n=1 Tax=Populibacterium corticicola TaxID=1812826 RepID=A0ABW5XCB1_9MICO